MLLRKSGLQEEFSAAAMAHKIDFEFVALNKDA